MISNDYAKTVFFAFIQKAWNYSINIKWSENGRYSKVDEFKLCRIPTIHWWDILL